MQDKLTFLLFPIDATGHVNSFLGVAGPLRDRGHKVVFGTPIPWKGKFESQGFVEECYLTADPVPEDNATPFADKWGEIVSLMSPSLAKDSHGQIESFLKAAYRESTNQIKYAEPSLRRITEKVKPDLIIVDVCMYVPTICNIGIPWVLLYSLNPIGISSKNVPPAFSGYAIDGDKSLWDKYLQTYWETLQEIYEEARDWVVEKGGEALKPHQLFSIKYSPYANIYMYPIELDYTAYRPNPPNWHRFDSFVRMTDESFEIPEKLKNLPGKLIYFSMGTIGCSELGLMRRLIEILGKSPHRFIVSKGPLADQYELADNMWGDKSVPQTKVIPLVDLVITHGGNNTITESFYFGKRVLVLPLFCDQLDNGQRIFETGLGLQFHPYQVTEQELLHAIETLLTDDLLERRMISISKRIQSSNSQSAAADLVENVAARVKELSELMNPLTKHM